jgi:putative CocE/NonD family hydrolase
MAYVCQEFRGTYKSNGTFTMWALEYRDAEDTIKQLVNLPWTDKRIFSFGGSANAIAAYLSGITSTARQYIHGQCYFVGTADVYRFFFQGGSYIEYINGWMKYISHPELEKQTKSQEAYTDLWYSRSVAQNVKPTDLTFPTVHITNWWDILLGNTIEAFEFYRQNGRNNTYLIVGGYGGHCSKGQIELPGSDKFVNAGSCLPIFNSTWIPKPILVYVMASKGSTIGNTWVNIDDWPTTRTIDLYLGLYHDLNGTLPSTGYNYSYIYDPANPIKSIGGNIFIYDTCGSWDQRPIEKSRKDLILFTSQMAPVDIVIFGQMSATLFVSSNASDTDFLVKFTDVYPDGSSLLIQEGIQRMKWRLNDTVPVLMEKGVIYQIEVKLWPTAYVLPKGHQLRVAISSSNTPRWNRNPNNGIRLDQGDEGPLVIAENTLFVGGNKGSKVSIPYVSASEFLAMDTK